MSAQHGKDLLMKILTGGSYTLVGGFRSNGITINDQSIDVTTKSSGDFRELMEGGSFRSISISGSGVFVSDAAFGDVHGHVLAGTHPDCELVIPGFGTYQGKFQITSLAMTGEHNGEVTYSLSLESAGSVTFTAA